MFSKKWHAAIVLPAAFMICWILPLVMGSGLLALLLVLQPFAAVVLLARDWQLGGLLGLPGLLIAGLVWLPGWLLPLLLTWLGLHAIYLLLGKRLYGVARAGGICAVCGAGIVAALVVTTLHYPGGIFSGMADSLCALIEGLPDALRIEMLVNFYSYGMARLDDTMANTLVELIRTRNTMAIDAPIQLELLNSFRTTMEITLEAMTPEWLVNYVIGVGVFTALLGEKLRLGAGRKREMPHFTAWYMPTPMGRMALVMLLFGVVSYFVDGGTLRMLSVMCRTMGYWAFVLQGLAAMNAMMFSAGATRWRQVVFSLLGMMIAPFLLMVLGIFDQFRDPRKLREDFSDAEDM